MADGKEYIKSSDEKGSINISEEVVAVIAAAAAMEVEGVHGLFNAHSSKDLSNIPGKKGMLKGVRLSIDDLIVTIDVYVIAKMGFSVSEVGTQIQKTVLSAVQDAVKVSVNAVNVHICGVALKKNK